jgi:DNA-binding protein H-NS
MARTANINSLSVDKLVNLRSQVDAMLTTKVAQQKRSLETQLAELTRFSRTGPRGKRLGMRGGAVPPKYRNPENESETWAGRGLKPRWLAAAIKAGHKLDDFLIDKKTGEAAPKRRKMAKQKMAKPSA